MTQVPAVYSPITVAIALALYGYNVSSYDRAERLYNHFNGECAEMRELIETLERARGWEATALAHPTAAVYVQHALETYGEEALQRVAAETIFRAQIKKH